MQRLMPVVHARLNLWPSSSVAKQHRVPDAAHVLADIQGSLPSDRTATVLDTLPPSSYFSSEIPTFEIIEALHGPADLRRSLFSAKQVSSQDTVWMLDPLVNIHAFVQQHHGVRAEKMHAFNDYRRNSVASCKNH